MLYSLHTDIVNKPQKQTNNTVNCLDYLMVYVTLRMTLRLVKISPLLTPEYSQIYF